MNDIQTNVIIVGDCRSRMKDNIPDESVDLVYLDPPFFSSNGYNLIWGEKDSKATIEVFEDAELYKKVCGKCGKSWRVNPKTGKYYAACSDGCKGRLKDTESAPRNTPEIFTEWLRDAIKECYRVLKPTGSIYCHLDYHTVHYVKVMMDEIFGYENMRSEIIWRIGWVSGFKTQKKGWIRNHDTILYYVKSDKYTFNKEYIPYPEDYVRRDGKKPTGKGVPLEDTWNCNALDPLNSINIMSFSKEKLGYATQKPLTLLERIIKASSNPGDVVLDPFCGCGTAIVSAHNLKRRWIGIDIEPLSCTVMQTRMYNEFKIDVPLIDLERTLTEDEAIAIIQQSHKMKPIIFQDWVVEVLNGKPNPKKIGDGGIDGWIDKPLPSYELTKGDPIQVKMQAKVGDPTIRLFAFDTMNEGREHGIIVAYSFSSTAEAKVKEINGQHGIDIQLMTVRDMLIQTSANAPSIHNQGTLERWTK